jgi:hypothetical protein
MSNQNKQILSGPGKSDLMFALFNDQIVEFHFETGTRTAGPPNTSLIVLTMLEVRITALEHKDGSGDSWLYKGYLETSKVKFSGWYNSKTRKGSSNISLSDKFQLNKKTFDIIKKRNLI